MTVFIINPMSKICGQSTFPSSWKSKATAYLLKSQGLKPTVGTCASQGYSTYKKQQMLNLHAPGPVTVKIYTKPPIIIPPVKPPPSPPSAKIKAYFIDAKKKCGVTSFAETSDWAKPAFNWHRLGIKDICLDCAQKPCCKSCKQQGYTKPAGSYTIKGPKGQMIKALMATKANSNPFAPPPPPSGRVDCLTKPPVCKNGGKCDTIFYYPLYKCDCAFGYEGKNCEKKSLVYGKPLVDQITTGGGLKGWTTYRLSAQLQNGAKNMYTIFGSKGKPMDIPAAYQVPAPFGKNIGGVNPAFTKINKLAAYDSWLTVGITNGDPGNALGSAGIADQFKKWGTAYGFGFKDEDCGIFWMNPKASTATGKVVVAQLTLKSSAKTTVKMGILGKLRDGVTTYRSYVQWNLVAKSSNPFG